MTNGLGKTLALAAMSMMLTGCVGAPMDDPDAVYDPLEKLNRGTFAVNECIDKTVLEPVARGYDFFVPDPMKSGIRNFLRNVRTPIILGNQLLQGDLQGTGHTLMRLVLNSMGGVLGLVDVAEGEGYPYENEDFGQTMAVWGLGDGPYIVLPILGPSNARDTVGLVVDAMTDPVNLYLDNIDKTEMIYARAGTKGIDVRSRVLDEIEDLRESSVDYYASRRSIYVQMRESEIENGDVENGIPDYDEIQ